RCFSACFAWRLQLGANGRWASTPTLSLGPAMTKPDAPGWSSASWTSSLSLSSWSTLQKGSPPISYPPPDCLRPRESTILDPETPPLLPQPPTARASPAADANVAASTTTESAQRAMRPATYTPRGAEPLPSDGGGS